MSSGESRHVPYGQYRNVLVLRTSINLSCSADYNECITLCRGVDTPRPGLIVERLIIRLCDIGLCYLRSERNLSSDQPVTQSYWPPSHIVLLHIGNGAIYVGAGEGYFSAQDRVSRYSSNTKK